MPKSLAFTLSIKRRMRFPVQSLQRLSLNGAVTYIAIASDTENILPDSILGLSTTTRQWLNLYRIYKILNGACAMEETIS